MVFPPVRVHNYSNMLTIFIGQTNYLMVIIH
jgi:hypothetical protein